MLLYLRYCESYLLNSSNKAVEMHIIDVINEYKRIILLEQRRKKDYPASILLKA